MTRNVESIFGAVVTAPHQIPYTYTATGGETFISLPFYPVTGFITINGGVQVPTDNFEIDDNTINLGRVLEAGDVVYCLFDKILSPEDYENGIRIYKFQAVGNETTFTPDFTTYGVQSLYVDGKFQVPDVDYSYNSTTGVVSFLTGSPTAGVWVVSEMSIKQNYLALSSDGGASQIGTSSGQTVQEEINNLRDEIAYTDNGLREDLASASGATLVGLPGGGTVDDVIKYFTPEMFGAAATYNANVDDQPFVQAAITAAEATGAKMVVLQRQYKLIAAPNDFVTPGDDGTVYPGWVGNGDENLPPEDRPIQKFHLKILNGTRLIGLTRACGFTGGWDPLTSPIAIEQPGMLLVTRAPGSSYLGTLTNHIANFTYSNFFVGIIFEGIIFQSRIEDLKPTSCGIAMIGHANENSVYRNIDYSGCYSGIILGGWWNFRARISGGNATSVYVPPYDGTGGNLMGWCDGADFFNIGFSVAVRLWGDRHKNFDTWYGRYFYKNANSALTSNGGRASNNTDSGDTATYSPFYGITSRAITILSRNGRGNGNNNVQKLRTNGTHRAPIFVNRANRCTLQDAHVERSGWVDANTRSQIFGVDVQDPRRPAGFLQCTLAEGFIPLVGDYDMTASVSSKPLIPGGWRTRRSSTALDGTSGLIGSSSYPQQIVWAQDGAPYEKILDRVCMQGNNAPDPANGNDLYIKTTDYYRMPALVLGNSANRFMHQQGTFTPVVKVGSTTIAPTGTPRGFYERVGDTVKCWINFYETGVDLSTLSGQVTIEGLPFALSSLDSTTSFPIVHAAYIKTNAIGLSATMSGTTISLRKNYSSAIFNGNDFLSGTEHFLQLQVEYTVARVGA